MVDLRIQVDGRPAGSQQRPWRWSALAVRLGVGYQEDTATLTLANNGFDPPRNSAVLSFAAGGANLGSFGARDVGGSTRDGTIRIECAALDPEAQMRKPRDRSWRGGSIASIADTIASDAGLTPAVNRQIGSVVVAARPQIAVSDIAFLQRLVERHSGRLLIQERRLIVTRGDEPAAAPPALRVDLRKKGAWAEWRRGWSQTVQRIQAAFVLDDGVTLDVVEVGSGNPMRKLPDTFSSREEAEAAARRHLAAGDVSRDYLEIHDRLLPTAQVLQPLDIVGGALPVSFTPLVVHAVQHSLGRSVAETVITARPAAST